MCLLFAASQVCLPDVAQGIAAFVQLSDQPDAADERVVEEPAPSFTVSHRANKAQHYVVFNRLAADLRRFCRGRNAVELFTYWFFTHHLW